VGVELPELEEVNWDSRGYIKNEQGQITEIGLFGLEENSETIDLEEIVIILKQLPQLSALYLGSSQICDIAPLEKLKRLSKLHINSNQISNIAPLRKLNQLSTLDLSHNQIQDITPLEKLTHLSELDLGYNRVNNIASLKELKHLSKLYLDDNEIDDITPLRQIRNLSSLNLSYNQVSDIFPIKELFQIVKLKLYGNQIRDISPLRELSQITTLYLGTNQISDITPLESLSQITKLKLYSNQISDISPIKKLSRITTLYLGSNKITDISPLKELTQITDLQLHDNKINDITPVKKLSRVVTLYLGSNKIGDIAPLKELTQIIDLQLHDNQISNIAPIKALSQITILYLGANKIDDISPLKELTHIFDLQLHNNQINDITPLKKLSQITSLQLHNNQINTIAPLKKLTQLSVLDLHKNKIEILPIWITEFEGEINWSVKHISSGTNLYGNPLQTPPPEIVKQGKAAITNYFAQLDKQKENYLFEAKMLIVGEPGAGKTSLAWKIEDEDCELPKKEDTTKGINVLQYEFPLSKEKVATLTKKKKEERGKFRLNLWDFGGQEIYKATHRFFLSKRSLYALVADSRNEDTDFNYWLHIVEMFGGDSPLLIVLNEKYERKKTLDIPAMKARFENIVDVISVDFADDDKARLNQLTQAIRYHVSRLPHIGSPVPAKWTIVREALEKNENNTITLQDYLRICSDNSIKKTEDALVLSQYFHDIGVFLHFQNDPLLKNTLFLNSTWATQAVYQILDNPLLNEQDGRFSKEDAEKIWSAGEFTLLRSELLQLMKKFFLTYEIGNSGEYIVPERLPANTPEYEWEEKDNLIVQYDYDFFMPKGILSQFIVQMNRYIKNHHLVWKRGVILERENTRAEVTESYDARKIKIRVAGRNRRDFMTIISEKFDELNAQYEKMKVEKLIPCNCDECKADGTPYFYKYADLSRRIEKGRREVECGRSYEMVNVRGLIDDVINEGMRGGKRNTTEPKATRKKVFVSYSHKDDEWIEKVQEVLNSLSHLDINFDLWDDTRIESGDLWREEIETALAKTDIAILLISTPFLASNFIKNDELPHFLKSAEEGGTAILPVILSHSIFGKTELNKFQAVNDPSKPLSALSESEQDEILVSLAERVVELVG